MNINAQNLDYYQLNQAIRRAEGPVVIDHCLGQRFIGTALGAGRSLTIHGVPGNAMGAYLDGGSIEVFGDVQEAGPRQRRGRHRLLHAGRRHSH